MNTPAGTELPISHNVSEVLVTVTTEVEQTEVTPITAPEEELQRAAATRVPASPSLWERATGRAWSTGGGITVRQPRESERPREEGQEALQSLSPSAPTTELPLAQREQLLDLQWRTEMAELTTREALARRSTAEHLLAAQDLEDALSRHSRSSSPPAERPPSPPRFPSGTSDVASLVQLFEEQRRADRREADEQRREDRRAAEEREERYHRAAEDREARREAHHEAQLAALATRHSADKHPGGYIPNKGFNDIKPYSGDRGQGLLPWLQLFRSRANLLHTPDADIARELCLKLEGPALQSYNHGFAADASPTFAEVAAHLSKVYITPYQGAVRWGAFFRFKRPSGSSGKEVKQQLHNARQGCLDEGIPLDELSSAEHLYYIYQLSLTPAQSAQFLASLSSNAQASDDYLRTLTPTGAADRRTSVAGPTSSAARTALFQLRVTLIEAFLDHDCGDAGQGGRGQAAVTTGSTDEPAAGGAGPGAGGARPGDGGSADTASPPSETECRLRLARADRDRESLPPPEYLGPNDKHQAANTAELQKRRDGGSCYACRMGRVQYNLFHLKCLQHGLPATPAQRADPAFRVKGAAMPGKRF